jgi:hypothetical protein
LSREENRVGFDEGDEENAKEKKQDSRHAFVEGLRATPLNVGESRKESRVTGEGARPPSSIAIATPFVDLVSESSSRLCTSPFSLLRAVAPI